MGFNASMDQAHRLKPVPLKRCLNLASINFLLIFASEIRFSPEQIPRNSSVFHKGIIST